MSDISRDEIEEIVENKIDERIEKTVKDQDENEETGIDQVILEKLKKKYPELVKSKNLEERNKKSSLSRRSFLKMLGIGAGGMALSSSVSAAWGQWVASSQGTSDIDADTVDGNHASDFLQSGDTTSTKWIPPGTFKTDVSGSNWNDGDTGTASNYSANIGDSAGKTDWVTVASGLNYQAALVGFRMYVYVKFTGGELTAVRVTDFDGNTHTTTNSNGYPENTFTSDSFGVDVWGLDKIEVRAENTSGASLGTVDVDIYEWQPELRPLNAHSHSL